jgi:acetyl-CoA carboxylase biotin carboxylase subunit
MAQAEAQASFGSGEILIEKCVVQPRHVEIQVMGDQYGNMVYLGERECSIQNLRHQKIVEEAPFADMDPEIRRAMGEAAVRVALSVGYFNAGTVEFLLDDQNNFYFLEMNTRLQVEHPVTEEITGVDLMHLMFHIEARITAQDPDQDFAPSTGKITQWIAPSGRGVRMETHCYAGLTVSPFYDPLLAKVIVTAETRAAAVDKLRVALDEFQIEGIKTNLPFLRRLTRSTGYRSGKVDTSWVPRFLEGTAE